MGIKTNILFSKWLLIFFLFTFQACGLDTFYNLEPPVNIIHKPLYNTADHAQMYFDFYTNDAANKALSGFNYLGTAVYYRIYNNYSTMLSRNASIDAVNNSSNYNTAAERLISYGYKELNTSDGSVSPLVAPSSSNSRHVQIRLTDYNEMNSSSLDTAFLPYIKVDGSTSGFGTPRREEGKYKFDFGRTSKDSECPKPNSSDSDFESGSFSEANKYYVDMYAVAVGRDTSYTTYYSNVLHLGAVPIDASSERN
ncbi:MAG: hypothetical protein ACI4LX_03420 [Treponema sp.]